MVDNSGNYMYLYENRSGYLKVKRLRNTPEVRHVE